MTRRDFQLIASGLAADAYLNDLDETAVTGMIVRWTDRLTRTNGRFDSVRFGKAVTAEYDRLKGVQRPRELVGPQVGENEPQ